MAKEFKPRKSEFKRTRSSESKFERLASKHLENKRAKAAQEAEFAKKNPEAYSELQKSRERSKQVRSAGTKALLTTVAATFPGAAEALKKNPQLAASIAALPKDQQATALGSLERVTSGVNPQQQQSASSGLGGVFH